MESSSSSYSVHLAMAALVGASLVAVSAYYMHKRTVTELLDFARAVERRDRTDSPKRRNPSSKKRNSKGSSYRRASTSHLPDVTAAFTAASAAHDLQTLPEGKQSVARGKSCGGRMIRPTSPKSPVASVIVSASAIDNVQGRLDDSASAIDNVQGGSDDYEDEDHHNLTDTFFHPNRQTTLLTSSN